MSKSDRGISRWTEVIGVLGVITSLVFVGVEIAQNTRALRGATYQSVAESSMTLLFFVAEHPEVGVHLDAWGRGDQLEPEVVQRVEAMLMAYMRHLENAHYQMTQGTLEPEFLENWASQPTFSTPRFPEFWAARRAAFSQAFRDYFDERRGLL